ncbi:MAG: hypothetical protein ABGZ17_17685, partial [Planctomycetaceae bacterium]
KETRMESRKMAAWFVTRIRIGLPLLSVSLMGCLPGWMTSHTPLQRAQPCVLTENVSKQELVAHLNRNRERLHSWRSTDVTIQAVGAGPMRLGASLAVQRPRQFRLIAKSLRGIEADLGSNTDRFWYWMRADGTPYVFTASHGDGDLVRQQLEIPFQPEWLMEALGVVPLRADDFEIQRHGLGDQRVSLVSMQASTAGPPLYREMIVDTCHGWVIEHGLYDADRQPLARAVFSEYAAHSGILMPHRVELTFPRNGQALVLRIGDVEVNPERMESVMWEFPRIPDHRPLDVGQQIRRMHRRRGVMSATDRAVVRGHLSDQQSAVGDDADGWWETPTMELPMSEHQRPTVDVPGETPLRMVSAPVARDGSRTMQQAAEFPWAGPSDAPQAELHMVPRSATGYAAERDEPMWADPASPDD